MTVQLSEEELKQLQEEPKPVTHDISSHIITEEDELNEEEQESKQINGEN